jgi:hypothetical protein
MILQSTLSTSHSKNLVSEVHHISVSWKIHIKLNEAALFLLLLFSYEARKMLK